MWPWEHVVVGYMAYSLLSHAWRRRPPRAPEAALVAGAALLPDLVDKPLAWSLGIVSTGYGPAHSIFLAVPVVFALATAWWAVGRPWHGVAFATGYLLHLPGDVLYNLATNDVFSPEIVLWPVVTATPGGLQGGLVETSLEYLGQLAGDLAAGELSTYTWLQLCLLVLAFLLWLYDGAPPLSKSREAMRPALDRWF